MGGGEIFFPIKAQDSGLSFRVMIKDVLAFPCHPTLQKPVSA